MLQLVVTSPNIETALPQTTSCRPLAQKHLFLHKLQGIPNAVLSTFCWRGFICMIEDSDNANANARCNMHVSVRLRLVGCPLRAASVSVRLQTAD